MAKFIAQLIITSTQVIGRAFAKAVKQEIHASQQAARNQRSSGSQTARDSAISARMGISVDEAMQILNVDQVDKEEIAKRYEHLFKANERTNGGSFYIQSKIVRAKERLDQELLKSKETDAKTTPPPKEPT